MKLKNKIIENRVGLLITIGILLIVTIIVGISYAYFGGIEIKNNNTVSGNINTNSYIFTTNGTGVISLSLNNVDLDVANASNDYSSYVSNTGSNINVSLDANGLNKVYCSYDLVYIPSTAYTPSSGATNAGLKEFTLSGTSDKGNSFSEIDVSGSSAVTLISSVKISTNTNILEKWSFTAKYYNLDVIQDNVVGKTFKGNIKVANTNCSFNEPILGGDYVLLKSTGASSVAEAKSQIESKTKPDFSIVTTASDKGMFSAPDDLGTSYYFRGAVDNNWVKYGKENENDIYWRIIRINGDGSIRMIYSGTAKPSDNASVTGSNGVYMTGTNTQIGTSTFNSSRDKAEYVGYMYTVGEQMGNSTPSTIKIAIENWYEGTTLKDNPLVSQNQIFCNDRGASSEQTTTWESTGINYFYGAYGRLNTYKNPQLICTNVADKFTAEKSTVGNKKLNYPVGLITVDEVAFAGGVYGSGNNSYYLYTGQPYWTGSSSNFLSSGGAYEFYIHLAGYFNSYRVSYSIGVRPVISLSSKAKLSGSGTYNDVYTVVE